MSHRGKAITACDQEGFIPFPHISHQAAVAGLPLPSCSFFVVRNCNAVLVGVLIKPAAVSFGVQAFSILIKST
jgi:hypothetical protein